MLLKDEMPAAFITLLLTFIENSPTHFSAYIQAITRYVCNVMY